jgi:adenine-specific DNA methylase
VVVGLTGTLWVAIVVHIVHDAVLGTMVGRRARLDESTGSGGAGGADPRAGAGDDPLEALRAGLAARGIELDQAMVDEVRRELERDDTGSR